MSSLIPNARFSECLDCGACMWREQADQHKCDKERWLDAQIARLRPDIARFDADYAIWLLGPHGRFEAFYAETRRP